MNLLKFNFFESANRNGSSIFAGSFKANHPLFGGEKPSSSLLMAQNQIAALEDSLSKLRERDEISPELKLELFHNLKNEIAATKHAYNNKRMFETVEEMMEEAEKIAEMAENMKPKTPEDRKEELLEEALGLEEGTLEEITDELQHIVEDMTKEMTKEMAEEMAKDILENIIRVRIEKLSNGKLDNEFEITEAEVLNAIKALRNYKPFDIVV